MFHIIFELPLIVFYYLFIYFFFIPCIKKQCPFKNKFQLVKNQTCKIKNKFLFLLKIGCSKIKLNKNLIYSN